MKSIYKIQLSFLILFLAWAQAMAIAPEEALKQFIKESGVPAGSMAVKIVDLKDGSTMASHNSSLPLVPASILKSVTTATLLEHVGTDWRYHTRVYIDGPTDMGILRGNIIVVGCCDPSLNSNVEPFGTDIITEITENLRYLNINRIEGNILIDESEFYGNPRPASWAAADHKKAYGTGCHALNFNNNSKGDFSVERPHELFLSQLKSSLAAADIPVDGKTFEGGRRIQLLDHVSQPVDEIMRSCMMRSDNLFAESMLRTYGKLSGGDGSVEDSSMRELSFCQEKGYPMSGIVIRDGSGLSRENRVTADFMEAILSGNSGNPDYASFFPFAGQEGTLRKFLADTPLDSYIAMKTGSMTGIQCYAGYRLDDDYVPTHVIVVIMNDIGKSRDRVKKATENMLLNIFDTHENSSDNG